MRRPLTLAAASTASLALATAALGSGTTQHCARAFSVAQFRRAVLAAYSGTDMPPRGAYGHLWRMVRCQRTPGDRARARRVWNRAHDAWRDRRHPLQGPVVASYYTTEGVGACGYGSVQTGYRFASLILGCGTMIEICHGSRCEAAEMVDHGPYVGGRTFDLNANLASALACGGICDVTWRSLK